MDVDIDNFSEVLEVFCDALATASFVAIDLEMTGIKPDGVDPDDYWEPPELRYPKRRDAAASFGIVQVGVCLFQETSNQGTDESFISVQPFNFFLFPRPVNEPPDCMISPKLLLDADATHFIRCNGMDFGRWLSKGITYLDRPGELALDNALAKRWLGPWLGSTDVELSGREESQRNQFMRDVDARNSLPRT